MVLLGCSVRSSASSRAVIKGSLAADRVTLVLPLTLYRPIFIAIYKTDEASASKNILARFIGFLIFVAGLLLFWTPVFIWKLIVRNNNSAAKTCASLI
jgi:hypothetical protein